MSLCCSFPYVSLYEALLVIKGHFWEWKSVRHKRKIWIFWKRQWNLSYFEVSIGLQIHRLTLSWSVAANNYGKKFKQQFELLFFNTSFSCLKVFTLKQLSNDNEYVETYILSKSDRFGNFCCDSQPVNMKIKTVEKQHERVNLSS